MAEMQRRKPKKEKPSSVDLLEDTLLDVTDKSSSKTTDEVKITIKKEDIRPSVSASVSTTRVVPPSTKTIPKTVKPKIETGIVPPEVKAILPSWVNKPWRYMIPDSNPELKEAWFVTWSDFIIDYARVLKIFLLNINEIASAYPFRNPVIRQKLTIEQLVMLGDYLVERNKAKWWDPEDKVRLRVYWKTMKQHADDFYDYALLGGYDIVTAFDIAQMEQEWSSLPPREIRELMKILVETGRANWADKKKKSIELIYD